MQLLDAMVIHNIGQRGYYELLALEFVKKVNEHSLKDKAHILAIMANADVDADSLLKTAHMVTASTLQAHEYHLDALQDDREIELPPGLHTDEQERLLFKALDDLQQHDLMV